MVPAAHLQGYILWDDFLGYCIDATLKGRRNGNANTEIRQYRFDSFQSLSTFEGIQRLKYVKVRLTPATHVQPPLPVQRPLTTAPRAPAKVWYGGVGAFFAAHCKFPKQEVNFRHPTECGDPPPPALS